MHLPCPVQVFLTVGIPYWGAPRRERAATPKIKGQPRNHKPRHMDSVQKQGLDAAQQQGWTYAQRTRKPEQCRQRRLTLSTLHQPDESPVHITFQRKGLLRESPLLPKLAEHQSKGLLRREFCHGREGCSPWRL